MIKIAFRFIKHVEKGGAGWGETLFIMGRIDIFITRAGEEDGGDKFLVRGQIRGQTLTYIQYMA